MAWNTGCSSPGELLMTRSTSEVAACCSNAFGKPLLRLGKLAGSLVELLLELGGGTATTFCG
jgi:hypothetical protein